MYLPLCIQIIMASMEGKVIAITGGASGIGLATAKLLASRGAKLSIADVQENALQEAASAIKSAGHGDVHTCVVDVRKAESVEAWVKQVVDKFGQLDCCANIAGVFRAGSSIEVEDENTWDFMISVNLTGVMHCLRAQLPHMKEGGSVVNAASILGIYGAPGSASYAASKHGVVGLTRSAAKDVGKRGIRVNCFAPYASPIEVQTYMLTLNSADTSRRRCSRLHKAIGLRRKRKPGRVAEQLLRWQGWDSQKRSLPWLPSCLATRRASSPETVLALTVDGIARFQ